MYNINTNTNTNTNNNTNDNKNHIHRFEFGGPIGATFLVTLLPILVLVLYYGCNKEYCATWNISSILQTLYSTITNPTNLFNSIFDKEKLYNALIIYVGWMLFQLILERILPGEIAEGVPLEDGTKLKYTISGHLQFWISILAMGHIIPQFIEESDGIYLISRFQSLPLSLTYDYYPQLIIVSSIGSLILSIYLYSTSFIPGRILAKGGNTGYHIYDFWIGRELNPRIGSLDLKEFCELRPGLIGWFVLNLGMAVQQIKNDNKLSLSMVCVTLFQGLYVWDALFQEKAILTTMDITTDGFGYMLAFGDLTWVPFIYSLQARYIVDHDPKFKLWQIIIIVCIYIFGMYIFRSANSQKDAFRKNPNDPSVIHLKYLETKRGTRLLTSGWWGLARKINYTGDWIVTLSWCLFCGFESPVPYFQAVYFAILLYDRAIRDDHMCREKYGADWDEYKKKVPYMFIPKVF